MINLNPDNSNSNHISNDLISLYQRAHEELYQLQSYEPSNADVSPAAEAVRLAIADRQRMLRALAVALAGRRPGRVGQHLLPLGEPLLSLN